MHTGGFAALAILLVVLVWFFSQADSKFADLVRFALLCAPVFAAFFALRSARAAQASAQAANQNLEEQRAARRAQVRPRIVAEVDRAWTVLRWRGAASPPQWAMANTQLTLTFRNLGGGHGIRPRLHFTLNDGLEVPPTFASAHDVWPSVVEGRLVGRHCRRGKGGRRQHAEHHDAGIARRPCGGTHGHS